jgi:hypothetical protein
MGCALSAWSRPTESTTAIVAQVFRPKCGRFTLNHLHPTRHREPLLGGVAIHRAGGMDRFVASAPRDDETG